MSDDDVRDDALLADTLGAFGTRPLLDGTPEPHGAPSDPTPEWHTDEEPPDADASRLGRLVGWVRWAAAPLGFFFFLAGLTAYGVLRDRDGSTVSDSRPAVAPATTSAPATTPATTATTSVPASTAPVPVITVTPTTGPGVTVSTTVLPSASDADAAPSPAADDPPVRRYGPVCGYAPGQKVEIVINGRREGTASADADGCVSVTR